MTPERTETERIREALERQLAWNKGAVGAMSLRETETALEALAALEQRLQGGFTEREPTSASGQTAREGTDPSRSVNPLGAVLRELVEAHDELIEAETRSTTGAEQDDLVDRVENATESAREALRAEPAKDSTRAEAVKAALARLAGEDGADVTPRRRTDVSEQIRALTMDDRLRVATQAGNLLDIDTPLFGAIADVLLDAVRCCGEFPECSHVLAWSLSARREGQA